MKFIVPLTSKNLFFLEDESFLRLLGIDERWVMEYVLHMWFALLSTEEDMVFEQIVDDVSEAFFRYDDTPEDDLRQRVFAEGADDFVALLRRLLATYQVYLREIPAQIQHLRGVQNIGMVVHDPMAGYSVVQIFPHDGEPV